MAQQSKPTPRMLAIAAGEETYTTGKPCVRGHVSPRYTKTRMCVECSKENGRRWREESPNYGKTKWAEWESKNRPYNRERSRKYMNDRHAKDAAFRERKYARNRARRAALAGAGGSHSARDVTDLLRRQKYKCAECKAPVRKRSQRHVDHILPISKGGTNDKWNLQILCVACNLSKGSKHPLDYARMKGRLV